MGYFWVLSAVAVFFWVIFRKTARRSRERCLRNACLKKLAMSPPDPDSALERHLTSLKERFPGKTERWYLEKILHDFERNGG